MSYDFIPMYSETRCLCAHRQRRWKGRTPSKPRPSRCERPARRRAHRSLESSASTSSAVRQGGFDLSVRGGPPEPPRCIFEHAFTTLTSQFNVFRCPQDLYRFARKEGPHRALIDEAMPSRDNSDAASGKESALDDQIKRFGVRPARKV